MLFKGIIFSVEETHLVVLSDNGAINKIQKRDHALVGQKIYYTNEDYVYTPHHNNLINLHLRKLALVAAMFIFIGSIINLNTEIGLPNEISVATIMTIDINPSVKLALDENAKVLEVRAINHDASTLDFTGIVGLSAEDAVEKIVLLAQNAGFINSEDLIDDYVLITTISLDDENGTNTQNDLQDNSQIDALKVKIEEKVASSEVLQDVNVAIIKANKVEMKIAEEKQVPIGLYVVQGNVEDHGENITVKEYFSHQAQVETFKNKGEIIQQNNEAKLRLITKYINKLKDRSYDVTILENELAVENPDINYLLDQIRAIWTELDEASNGDHNNNSNNSSNNGHPSIHQETTESDQPSPDNDNNNGKNNGNTKNDDRNNGNTKNENNGNKKNETNDNTNDVENSTSSSTDNLYDDNGDVNSTNGHDNDDSSNEERNNPNDNDNNSNKGNKDHDDTRNQNSGGTSNGRGQ